MTREEIIQAIASIPDAETRKKMLAELLEADQKTQDRRMVRDTIVGGYRAVTSPPPGGLPYRFDARKPEEIQPAEVLQQVAAQREQFRKLMPEQKPPVERKPVE